MVVKKNVSFKEQPEIVAASSQRFRSGAAQGNRVRREDIHMVEDLEMLS